MSNPLYQQLMGNQSNAMMQQVQQLKKTIGGDPMQYIQSLLNSGKVTQGQYNMAVQRAQQLQQMMGFK